jgi:hypothetical protein
VISGAIIQNSPYELYMGKVTVVRRPVAIALPAGLPLTARSPHGHAV